MKLEDSIITTDDAARPLLIIRPNYTTLSTAAFSGDAEKGMIITSHSYLPPRLSLAMRKQLKFIVWWWRWTKELAKGKIISRGMKGSLEEGENRN
jgi:hypothetical protein